MSGNGHAEMQLPKLVRRRTGYRHELAHCGTPCLYSIRQRDSSETVLQGELPQAY
jgi:hypothetical protein